MATSQRTGTRDAGGLSGTTPGDPGGAHGGAPGASDVSRRYGRTLRGPRRLPTRHASSTQRRALRRQAARPAGVQGRSRSARWTIAPAAPAARRASRAPAPAAPAAAAAKTPANIAINQGGTACTNVRYIIASLALALLGLLQAQPSFPTTSTGGGAGVHFTVDGASNALRYRQRMRSQSSGGLANPDHVMSSSAGQGATCRALAVTDPERRSWTGRARP